MTGGVVSTKMICCTQLELLLQLSVAVQVRSTPSCPVQLVVATSLWVIAGVPPQLSVAVAEPVFAGAVESPHWRATSAGQVMTGGVVSTKVICWTQLELLLQLSV